MVTIVTLGFKFFKHLRPNNYLKKKKKTKVGECGNPC